MFQWASSEAEETKLLGQKLAAHLQPGDIVTLSGDLGAGKTTFAKGLISEITGCKEEEVTSPTFTYMQIFSGDRITVYHFDLYRLRNFEEFESLGFDEYLHQNEVCCIEWAERILPHLPNKRVDVVISRLDKNKRSIDIRRL